MIMGVKAVHKNARMSPRKIRPLATLVRNMSVAAAQDQLAFLPGKAPGLVSAVLKSAVANAVHNHNLQKDTLKVTSVVIDEGLVMKRHNPVSKGMAHPILKRSSHITVVVDGEAEKGAKQVKSEIKEISAGEYTAQQGQEEKKEASLKPAKKDPSAGVQETKEKTVSEEHNKTDYDVFQKKKMQQLGGDKKKTHRRKSIG